MLGYGAVPTPSGHDGHRERRMQHVGYFLVDKGRRQLEASNFRIPQVRIRGLGGTIQQLLPIDDLHDAAAA